MSRPDGEPTGPGVALTAHVDDPEELEAATTALVAALLDEPPGLVLTPSCSTALEIAAELVGVRPDDEVIVPSFTHPSTANAFILRGARVRLVDVEPDTLDIDPAAVEAALTERTTAVVPVHYAGVAADMDRLALVARTVGARLVEDAAQGLFGRLDGTPLGRLGTVGCLSFHRTKNVSAIAGGALVINDPSLVDRATTVADKGTNVGRFAAGVVDRYEWVGPGLDGRMAPPAMEVLHRSLLSATAHQRRRHVVWECYASALAPWAAASGTRLPVVPAGRTHPAHLFHLILPDAATRDRFVTWCVERSVGAARHFVALSDSSYGRALADGPGSCPVASDLAERLVRIPLHHELSDTDVDHVIDTVTAFHP